MISRTSRRSFLVAGLCCASWSAIACSGGGDPHPPAGVQAPPRALSDGEVLAIYNQTNTFDIETGRLGDARGASDAVRALGRMVVADHTEIGRASCRERV